jgi:hypothetical protein
LPADIPGHGGLHLQSAQAGPKGIVVVRHRSAKDGQDGVARELLD